MDIREANAQQAGAGRHPWELARFDVVERLLQERTPTVTGVLDVGCGDAFVLEQIAKRWPTARCVGVDQALNAPRLDVEPHLLQALSDVSSDPEGWVSHVLLLDVIEHVPDDVGLLREILALPALASGATFVITVPAHPGLFSRHDELLGHHRRYTSKALLDALGAAGIEVLDEGPMFSTLVPIRMLEVARERVSARAREVTGLSTWTGSPALTSGLRRVLASDFWLSERLRERGLRPPGLSHFAIGRAP